MAEPSPTPQIFGATCARTRVKSLTPAPTVDAASARALKWQPTGGPTAASAPTPALSVAGALARSQQWRSISGSIGQELGVIGTEKPVSYLYPWPQTKGTLIHLWASGAIQRYSRSAGGGLKSPNVESEIYTLLEAQRLEPMASSGRHRSSSKGWSWGRVQPCGWLPAAFAHTLIPLSEALRLLGGVGRPLERYEKQGPDGLRGLKRTLFNPLPR